MPFLRRLLFCLLPVLAACQGPSSTADLIVLDAMIWTADENQLWAEAMAVRGDRILAVGSSHDIQAYQGAETRVVQAERNMLVPGFIDTHVHFLQGGFNLASVQLRDANTPEEFVRRIAEFAQTVPEGSWILGGDWDHELWGGELPQRDWIDKLTPRHPVWINRLDGHMALANSLALERAGVDESTPEVEGGELVRDETGRLTGVFKDNAMELVAEAVPPPTPEESARALQAAMEYVAAQGVTSVHHMGSWDDLEVFQRAHAAGTLITRIYASVPLASWEYLADTVAAHGRGDEWLRIGGLKGFVDGSLGSHTAKFLEPFTDAPDDTGLLVNTPEDLYAWTQGADSAGLHVLVHAIGDSAIRLQLNVFEQVAEENGPRDRRFRIEHAQHIHPSDLKRFAEQEVIASMQPYHAIDDGRWAEKLIGPERARTTYAFRSLMDVGATVSFGSDWFVAPPLPLEGIYAAVTRRTLDGEHPQGWVPEQKIPVEQALKAYTIHGAYASFEEDLKGSLEPGKLADFVLLDRELTDIPPEAIRKARVLMTVVGGNVVYEGE